MSTIVAITTGTQVAGVAMLRISGSEALAIADRVYKPIQGNSPLTMDGYTCGYGLVYDGEELVDDVILTVFRAPKSYTGEDVVELSCHGGTYVTRRILRILLNIGAVMAQPGEFTKRAYLNGKVSLTEAESVMELVAARSSAAHRCAIDCKNGATYRRIHAFLDRMLGILARLSYWSDYPDETDDVIDRKELHSEISKLADDMHELLVGYDRQQITRNGVRTMLCGKPNVGKSTLFNRMLGYERTIVMNHWGTTRDVVNESYKIGDCVIDLCDTAGIFDSYDVYDDISIDRTIRELNKADLLLAVFDGSQQLDKYDEYFLNHIEDMDKVIGILNKSDLGEIEFDLPFPCVRLSGKHGESLEELYKVIEEYLSRLAVSPENGVIANERQRDALARSYSQLREGLQALEWGLGLDALTVNLDDSASCLMELTGERVQDKVVDEIFSRFCVGK